MSKVILVTGPARSGKSEWAETLANQSGKKVIYIATALLSPDDKQWQQRIIQHRNRRPQSWITLEVPFELSDRLADVKPDNIILVDSLGTWVANFLDQDDKYWLNTVEELLETIQLVAAPMIFVAEETGWGVVPAYPLGQTFRDRLGSLTRKLGVICQTAYLVTGGHVLNLSALGTRLPS
ncbi:bifunctional adenosylcobinamide kinase/adenosylcobinamide-phosphate guanylyltransferase [Rivularia sp. UHCC 0363]|uniref:bifunctional adenosylcobinamide kinase/adenosylcobinamide-phosphate guanylyltransferase n=1 Tax=Rivularia sp. UHCC 0363 TaxID=3110244 RepID=UPI002B1F69DB|nr:bifunctional adenosylcobinamide kinase/adenosylcobinamide-phosphate guanylyltransferase [Rivularia sp. UHCC 0363]MEA5598876.1 bifunctional adenosylcobinamide kinase/adenosylcobinamide-phosphate guanylyltransferase [Rivularia sp. UHCC 0363]